MYCSRTPETTAARSSSRFYVLIDMLCTHIRTRRDRNSYSRVEDSWNGALRVVLSRASTERRRGICYLVGLANKGFCHRPDMRRIRLPRHLAKQASEDTTLKAARRHGCGASYCPPSCSDLEPGLCTPASVDIPKRHFQVGFTEVASCFHRVSIIIR